MGKHVKGERGGEVGEEELVVGWFISYKTPEAFHHIMEAEKSLHCIDAKKNPWLCMEKPPRTT